MAEARNAFRTLVKEAPEKLQLRIQQLLDSLVFKDELSTAKTELEAGQADQGAFVHISVNDTITAKHTFAPASATAPFALGTNSQGQLVTGLNADLLDGQHGSYYLEHGNLTGLADDDHTQYILVDGTRAFTGSVTIGNGAAGIDYALSFNGQTNDGSVTWMEDEARFDLIGALKTEGRYRAIRTETDTYTVQAPDEVIICNKGTPMSVNLPAATGSGRALVIKSIGAGLVTIDPSGVEQIDDAASFDINQYESVVAIDQASGEWVIA